MYQSEAETKTYLDSKVSIIITKFLGDLNGILEEVFISIVCLSDTLELRYVGLVLLVAVLVEGQSVVFLLFLAAGLSRCGFLSGVSRSLNGNTP